MNRDEIDKLMPVIEAFQKGSDVQYRHFHDAIWIDTDNPNFNPRYEWRIKPEFKVIYSNIKNTKYYKEKPMDNTDFYTYIRKDYIISFISGVKAVCNSTTVNFINKEWEVLQRKLGL